MFKRNIQLCKLCGCDDSEMEECLVTDEYECGDYFMALQIYKFGMVRWEG